MCCVTSKNWLDFGLDLDHVTLGLASELQLLWRRFALSECPLLILFVSFLSVLSVYIKSVHNI